MSKEALLKSFADRQQKDRDAAEAAAKEFLSASACTEDKVRINGSCRFCEQIRQKIREILMRKT